MPPVGNDIVDLRDPENAGKSGDSRFLGRVFTVGERDRIAGAANPDQLLWAFWAAKEAAYKAISRVDPAVRSAPRRYQVVVGDPATPRPSLQKGSSCGAAGVPSGMEVHLAGEVRTPRGCAAVRLVLNDEYVHALAAFGVHDPAAVVHRVSCLEDAGDVSDFGRRQLLCEIARLGDLPLDALAVRRVPSDRDAPTVFLHGRLLTAEISLSHDGRFTAFALRLPLVNPPLPEGAAMKSS